MKFTKALILIVGFVCLSFQALTPMVMAVGVTTEIDRTPAYYLVLNSIYSQLVSIQTLLNELIEEEAKAREKIAVNTPYGTVTSVSVNIDYGSKIALAKISYRNKNQKELSIPSTVSKDILKILAHEMSITTKELSPLLEYTYINGDILVKILVNLKNSHSITVAQIYADSTIKEKIIPPADIESAIVTDFFGMETVYQAFYDDYLDRIKKGEKPTEVIKFVSDLIKLSPRVVAPIIEFNY